MKSIFNEIEKLCPDSPIHIHTLNDNRYTVLTQNSDRTKSAFCFGVPIYRSSEKNIVDTRFRHNKEKSTFIGSNSKITITDSVCLQNEYGACHLSLSGKIAKKTEDAIFTASPNGYSEIRPTLNGLFFKVPCPDTYSSTIRITLDHLFESVRSNDKYFAIMRQNFIPFITVSCIGTLNDREKVIAPCEIRYEQISDNEYVLIFKTKSKIGKYMAYEINMQETKLFQDTTVESQHSTINNAFGSTAFIGETDTFGEQWLYSRLELINIPLLYSKMIIKAILHIPKLDNNKSLLSAYRVTERFCSFGSTWENKIPLSNHIIDSSVSKGYHHLDITNLIEHINKKAENFVIKAYEPKSKACVISTGDSFFNPLILEVNFR